MKALHNNAKIDVQDASNSEIEASIKWYEENIETFPAKFGRPVPLSWKNNLEVLKAERANRIGIGTKEP
jgi:hypothetical protein